jgi:uncharacterized cupin superfamily protein
MSDAFFRFLPGGDPVSGLQSTDAVPPEAFTTDDKSEVGHEYFASDDKKTSAGIWVCAPCVEEFDEYPDNEMITVISGSVTLTDGSGDSETFASGDTFFIAKGSKIRWEITEKLRKYYMVSS